MHRRGVVLAVLAVGAMIGMCVIIEYILYLSEFGNDIVIYQGDLEIRVSRDWLRTRKVTYTLTVEPVSADATSASVFYYVPSSDGLRQRVVSEGASADVAGATLSVRTAYGNRLVAWSIPHIERGELVTITHEFVVQMKSLSARPRLFVGAGGTAPDTPLYAELWRENTEYIQPWDPRVVALRDVLVRGDAWSTARDVHDWIEANVTYETPVENGELVRLSAGEVIEKRRGDCDDISDAYVSLLRSAGICSRTVVGAYGTGRYAPLHAWTEVYTQYGWVQADAANPNVGFAGVTEEYIYIMAAHAGLLEPGTLGCQNRQNSWRFYPFAFVTLDGGENTIVDFSVTVEDALL